MNRPSPLLAIAFLAALAGCNRQPSRSLNVSVLRDGAPSQAAAGVRNPKPIDMTCNLQTRNAARARDCSFTLGPDQAVYGPYRPLAAGAYAVEFEVATSPACPGAPTTFDVVTNANHFVPLGRQSGPVTHSGVQRLTITVDDVLADGAPFEFRTQTGHRPGACLMLKKVIVRPQ